MFNLGPTTDVHPNLAGNPTKALHILMHLTMNRSWLSKTSGSDPYLDILHMAGTKKTISIEMKMVTMLVHPTYITIVVCFVKLPICMVTVVRVF